LPLGLDAGFAVTPVAAESLRYALEVPAGRPVDYRLELTVPYPGEITLNAEWSGTRVLSFRLLPPGADAFAVRRSGPSPQVLTVQVEPWQTGDRVWSLSIHGLSGRDGGTGLLTLELPGPPGAPPPVAAPPQPEPAPEPAPALEPIPSGLPPSWERFARSVAGMREGFGDATRPDRCRWQDGLLAWAEARLEQLLDSAALPSASVRDALNLAVGAIHDVESLRGSTDPLVAGPPPQDPDQRRVWERMRESRIRPVESALDVALERIRHGLAPELQREDWPSRLISCVMACERHFDERVVLGESRAANLELAREQWERVLMAADLLDALTGVGPREAVASPTTASR